MTSLRLSDRRRQVGSLVILSFVTSLLQMGCSIYSTLETAPGWFPAHVRRTGDAARCTVERVRLRDSSIVDFDRDGGSYNPTAQVIAGMTADRRPRMIRMDSVEMAMTSRPDPVATIVVTLFTVGVLVGMWAALSPH